MLISEIYCSRQGEGLLTGTPSIFVRTSGCNLRCGFCDTPFASWNPEGYQASLPEVMEKVLACDPDAKHVVITGGEPMLPREIVQLCEKIRDAGFHITIETAGTIFRELDCDLMSISPKLTNSDPARERAGEWLEKHQSTRHRPDVVRELMQRYPYQLKFVVDVEEDMEEIESYLEQVKPLEKSRVLLMPQGTEQNSLEEKAAWLREICISRGYTFCPRMHIQWYGNRRGT